MLRRDFCRRLLDGLLSVTGVAAAVETCRPKRAKLMFGFAGRPEGRIRGLASNHVTYDEFQGLPYELEYREYMQQAYQDALNSDTVIPFKVITPHDRSYHQNVVFGRLYGAGPKKMAELLRRRSELKAFV